MAGLDQQVQRRVCEWLIDHDIQFYERCDITKYFEIQSDLHINDMGDLTGAAIFHDDDGYARYIYGGMPSWTVCELFCGYRGMQSFVYRNEV